jgi:putative Ca2+/H+ antiporter (TMEM165/GDT1 family)
VLKKIPLFHRSSEYNLDLDKDMRKKFLLNVTPDVMLFNEPSEKRDVMDAKTLLTVFTAVFIAELGDKTQLATLLFAADKEVSKLTVFAGASLALVVASGIGVLAGGLISHYISEKYLSYLAGAGFIGIGIWTLLTA